MNWLKPDLTGVDVPEWVNYLAQDSDGSWWGYSVEPLRNHRGWYENELGKNTKLREAVTGSTPSDWQNSVQKYTR